MNRRPTGPLIPRVGSRSERPLGLPGGAAARLAAGAALLLVLIVAIVLLASRCGGTAAAQDADCTKKPPVPPAGYAYASKYCVTVRGAGMKGSVSVPLTDRSSTRGLSLFANEGGKWNRLTTVQVTQDGTSAVNTTSIDVPKAFAVLRRTGGDFEIFAAVPNGGVIGADAARLASAAVPGNYVPAADGSVSGGPTVSQPGAPYRLFPALVAEGGAEAQAVTSLLGDDTKRAAHIDRIVQEANRGSFDGIEIDYTAVDPGLKKNFTSFIQALATKLHASNRKLIVRMPLPRREGNSWNLLAYDWPELAKSADWLVIAAEHDQSIYRTRVPEAVKYLSSTMDSRKLILEVTPLSEEKSEQGQPRTLTTAEALSIAGQITVRDRDKIVTNADAVLSADNINREGGSGPQWTSAGVVGYSYRSGNDQRTVWMENSFSVAFKLELIQLYKLGGVAVDNATADPNIANIWPAIEQYQAAGAPTLQQPSPASLRPQWLADGNAIPDAGNRALITWRTPPAPGRHTISVIVSEGTMRVTNSTEIDVKAAPPGTAAATPGVPTTVSRSTPAPTRGNVAPSKTATRGPR